MKLIIPAPFFVIFFIASSAWALPELDKTVEAFKSKLQSAGSYGAITGFIDWPSLYRDLSPAELGAANVGSPDDLKRLVDQFLENPERMLELEWQKKESELTPLQRELTRPRFEETKAEAVRRWSEQNKVLSQADFKIEISKVENDSVRPSSTVTLTDSARGETHPWKLRFEKIGEGWFLAPEGEIDISKVLASYTLNKPQKKPLSR